MRAFQVRRMESPRAAASAQADRLGRAGRAPDPPRGSRRAAPARSPKRVAQACSRAAIAGGPGRIPRKRRGRAGRVRGVW